MIIALQIMGWSKWYNKLIVRVKAAEVGTMIDFLINEDTTCTCVVQSHLGIACLSINLFS